MRIWIDVEDMFAFVLSGAKRPTGIQRLAFELCRALQRRAGEQLRFVRHDRLRGSFAVVPWSAVEGLFAGLAAEGGTRQMRSDLRVEATLRTQLRPFAGRLPRELREPLARMLGAQFQALVAAAAMARAAGRLATRKLRRLAARVRRRDEAPGDAATFAREVAAGDVLFAPGAAFVHSGYPALVARMQQAHGLRFALLLYDIIPVRRPEYVDRFHARTFRDWLDGILPVCDRLMAISRSAAAEAEDHARLDGVVLRDRIRPIPIGTGFGTPTEAAPTPHLPPAGSYVLFVSTLEARKNHLLLFRVWRRLLDELPPAEVPTLVFAGQVGWMVADLMQQLRNTDFLNGSIQLIDRPSDAELQNLYRGCLFTVFPSFYEGWGLPVSESLGFGKPCIISNATSLPEAGGALARYFDPEDVLGATALIRAMIADRLALAAWTDQVARDYVPVAWDQSAAAVLEILQ